MNLAEREAAIAHPLASRTGMAIVVGLLFRGGSLCPKCGYGTRVTSKRWAACKRCGRKRIPRKTMDAAADELFARSAGGAA